MQQFPLHFVSSILTALKKLDDLSSGICLEMGGSGGPQSFNYKTWKSIKSQLESWKNLRENYRFSEISLEI